MRNRERKWFGALLFLPLALSASGPLSAETISVGDEGIVTIQDAVDAALANADADDLIKIPPGDYTETVVIDYTTTIQESLEIKRQGKKGKVNITGASGTAITVRAATNVTLKNLILVSSSPADGLSALRIDMASNNIVCTKINGVAGDDFGAVVSGPNNIGCLFDRCDFSGMLAAGFTLDGAGHVLDGCSANDCGDGIVMTDQALLCVITDCAAIGNGSAGLVSGYISLDGNGHQVIKTEVGGSGDDGIYAVGNGHVLDGCTSNDNIDFGINLDDSSILVRDCSASGNDSGLSGGGLTATIQGGKYNDNTNHGINVTEGGTTVTGAKCKGNGQHGVNVAGGAAGSLVRDCKVISNDGEGIVVAGSLCWVEGNTSKGGDSLVDSGSNNGGRDNVLKDGGTNDF